MTVAFLDLIHQKGKFYLNKSGEIDIIMFFSPTEWFVSIITNAI